jgi:hypothetical protein
LEWKDLIPSSGFRKFVCQQHVAQEKMCQQEMRTAVWNNGAGRSRQKSSGEQSEPTDSVKDMPSRLPISSFFFTMGAEACY